ncbi:hypothetical protein [Rhodococcus sp. (in: high G+C Gram-positive bacteria)]|uniref:hypothetical protein n=1 Tax=Rhodococcus sp. TaxID=1831 RepID=UPI00257C9FC9|nr:hypothetical protein [Rhodococcus sp. (in: high G+C Gram-positive bacteria)]MBQ7806350.1 hypothetical protein [Rhodococcus sp. (in: high G+C Gram-positive bacteria)]
MGITDLLAVMGRLSSAQPLTEAYEVGFAAHGVWYSSQKEHLLGFWGEYNTPGAYNRKHTDRDAKFAYNHLRCPPGLLWLAEALGEERAVLERGIDAIKAAGPNLSSQCAAFRKVVPWSRIESLIEAGELARPGLIKRTGIAVARISKLVPARTGQPA